MSDKPSLPVLDRVVIFWVSFLAISLELFFTRVLNLKTFNHVVYVVIPFAILGYGIGANLYLLLADKLRSLDGRRLIAGCLLGLAGATVLSYVLIALFPMSVKVLEKLFLDWTNGFKLSAMYLLIMLPFVAVGFIVLSLFCKNPSESPRLYFWDLIGSGAGAVGFFFLINTLQVSDSLLVISAVTAALALYVSSPRRAWAAAGVLLAGLVLAVMVPEVKRYVSDGKGWENFVRYYDAEEYDWVTSRWHPMGRTDTFRLTDRTTAEKLYQRALGTFEINLQPFPDFTYFATNFLGGTPVYHFAPEGLAEYGSQLRPFTVAMEFPYILLSEPNVVVIGAGGGRDIFMARTHGAPKVTGAEINPGIVTAMSPGGALYDYSGRIYTAEGVTVENVDGRQLVKRLAKDSVDLIILNGVDTYSGLSSGAYAYAESYLYTKEAVMDYLRLLTPGGMVNFNRWMFPDQPRETLRLFVIVLDALKATGVAQPWEHVIVGEHEGWGMVLVKRTPFTAQERAAVGLYFQTHNTTLFYPSAALAAGDVKNLNAFDAYSVAMTQGQSEEFLRRYMFDVSVVTDDDPFFYKYYRWQDFRPTQLSSFSNYGSGFVIFLTQALVLANGLLFSLVFIVLPLWVFRRRGLAGFAGMRLAAFVTYFASLGAGFMLIEIPLMQKFSLLLGSPIHAISVILGALLISSGIGSYSVDTLERRLSAGGRNWMAVGLVGLFTAGMVFGSAALTNAFVGQSFGIRLLAVVATVFPLGFCLGTFFPAGLRIAGEEHGGAVAWAWGINCGFSVLGAMLSVILAQFFGFNAVLGLAVGVYVLAGVSFAKIKK